jgi:hypothetical protein
MFAESEKNRQLASKLLHAAHRIWVEDTDLVPVRAGPSRNNPFNKGTVSRDGFGV